MDEASGAGAGYAADPRADEVATFYLMFNTAPVGKYHLQLCTTTPCWLRGSDEVVAACRKFTGIKGWKETSEDGLFTMTEVECVGACVNAPVLQVNDDFYEDMDAKLTEELLSALKRGEVPKPGSMTGRQTSAPEGGATTLTTLLPPSAREEANMLPSDKDRIFTNLYGQHDWRLRGARARGDWDGTAAIIARGREAIVEEMAGHPACSGRGGGGVSDRVYVPAAFMPKTVGGAAALPWW